MKEILCSKLLVLNDEEISISSRINTIEIHRESLLQKNEERITPTLERKEVSRPKTSETLTRTVSTQKDDDEDFNDVLDILRNFKL